MYRSNSSNRSKRLVVLILHKYEGMDHEQTGQFLNWLSPAKAYATLYSQGSDGGTAQLRREIDSAHVGQVTNLPHKTRKETKTYQYRFSLCVKYLKTM